MVSLQIMTTAELSNEFSKKYLLMKHVINRMNLFLEVRDAVEEKRSKIDKEITNHKAAVTAKPSKKNIQDLFDLWCQEQNLLTISTILIRRASWLQAKISSLKLKLESLKLELVHRKQSNISIKK